MDLRQRVEILAKEIGKGGGGSAGDAYTKAQTDSLLSLKADKATTYTKTEVNNLISGIENIPLIEFTGTEDPDTRDVTVNFATAYKSLIEAGKPFKTYGSNGNINIYTLVDTGEEDGYNFYSYQTINSFYENGKAMPLMSKIILGISENDNVVYATKPEVDETDDIVYFMLMGKIDNFGVLDSTYAYDSTKIDLSGSYTYNNYCATYSITMEALGSIATNDRIIINLPAPALGYAYGWGQITSGGTTSFAQFDLNSHGQINSPVPLSTGDTVQLIISCPV